MPDRHRQTERLAAAARARLPAITPAWLAPLRAEIERLTRAASQGTLSDAQLLRRIQALHDRAPRLLSRLDPAPLADLLEATMAAALLNGIQAAPRPPEQK